MIFRASGKLLLTAEYTVLRGALALSIPTVFGQELHIVHNDSKNLRWQSFNHAEEKWFEMEVDAAFKTISTSNKKLADHLTSVLSAAQKLNPAFNPFGFDARTTLDFNPEWGLGSSSTLIYVLAQWAKIDALELFFACETGSGYDVATAMANAPILYSLVDKKALFQTVDFKPSFHESLFFVYLGTKQRSAKEVFSFAEKTVSTQEIQQISALTREVLQCKSLDEFGSILTLHEEITSKILSYPSVKQRLFSDFPNAVKSLGAWGGDFVLAICPDGDTRYFSKKGFNTILSWPQIIGK